MRVKRALPESFVLGRERNATSLQRADAMKFKIRSPDQYSTLTITSLWKVNPSVCGPRCRGTNIALIELIELTEVN